MPRRRHQNVTVREGTSEKNWYPLMAYLSASLLGYLFAFGYVLQFGIADGSLIPFGMLGAVNMLAGGAGLAAMIELFKDASYVRDTRRWDPKWWYYIGAPVLLSSVAIFLGWAIDGYYGAALAGQVLGPAMFLSHAHYMYERHNRVGVP